MSARLRAYFYLLITVSFWAISSPVAKFVLASWSPTLTLTIRFGLVSIILGTLIHIIHPKESLLPTRHKKLSVGSIVILSLLGTVLQIGLIYWGLEFTTSIEATLLMATSPIIVAIFSHIFLSEHMSVRKLLGISLGFVGSAVIIIKPILDHGFLLGESTFGNLLIVIANICWAVYVIMSKKVLRTNVLPILMTFWMFTIGFIGMAILYLLQPTPIIISPSLIISTIFLALGPGVIAYICYFKALKTIPPTDADLFNYLAPIIATPIGTIWLHEPLTLSFIIGATIIAFGVIIAEFTGRHRR